MKTSSDQAIQNLLNNSNHSIQTSPQPSKDEKEQEAGGRSICLRIKWEIYNKLVQKSKQERRSVNFLVNEYLNAALED